MYNRLSFSILVIFISAFLVFLSGNLIAQNISCPCIADTMFSGHSTEHTSNCGFRTNLRMKGWQGILVFKFDVSKLQGSKVESATLKVYCTGITGDGKSPLTLVDLKISTIAHDWIEGDGDYTPTDKASTYDYPGGNLGMKWAEKDFDGKGQNGVQINVEDVINGIGGSILNPEIPEVTFEVNKWTEIPLAPEPVQALVDGKQYGIVLWQPTIAINLDLASREAGGGQNAAVLFVRAKGAAVYSNGKLAAKWGELKL
jgi:hypothetical protein